MEDQQTQQDLFRQQWVHWQPQIYAYIRTLVFNRSDAEDLLQEVAQVLWRKIDQFEPGTRFDQWAFGVARNKVLNFQKMKARERVRFSDAFEEILANEAAAAAGNASSLLDTLESCVGKLHAEHRELLRRRYEPKATGRGVAQAIGLTESTLSRTLNKIYGLLMACIESSSDKPFSTRSDQ